MWILRTNILQYVHFIVINTQFYCYFIEFCFICENNEFFVKLIMKILGSSFWGMRAVDANLWLSFPWPKGGWLFIVYMGSWADLLTNIAWYAGWISLVFIWENFIPLARTILLFLVQSCFALLLWEKFNPVTDGWMDGWIDRSCKQSGGSLQIILCYVF